MLEKVYIVSPGAQMEEIKHYCFNECGKILMGVYHYLGGSFIPCKTDDCPCAVDALEMGEHETSEGELVDLTVRKLKDVPDKGLQLSLELEGKGERL